MKNLFAALGAAFILAMTLGFAKAEDVAAPEIRTFTILCEQEGQALYFSKTFFELWEIQDQIAKSGASEELEKTARGLTFQLMAMTLEGCTIERDVAYVSEAVLEKRDAGSGRTTTVEKAHIETYVVTVTKPEAPPAEAPKESSVPATPSSEEIH